MTKFWKTHFGQCIYQGPSGITVFQNPIYRWLTLGNLTLQSLINRYYPAQVGLYYIQHLTLAARTLPADSCLLGLGGAGVAHALNKIRRDIRIDAVEISAEIIQVATDYFMTDRLKNLHVIHQDANTFLQHCQQTYHHLIIDLFNQETFPVHCMHEDFFGHCKRILYPGGMLAVNLANMHERMLILKLIRVHFKHCTVIMPVKGSANVVLLAYNGDSPIPLLNSLQSSCELKNVVWDPHLGYVAWL